MARREPDALRQRWCRGCLELFLVCRSCDRGQRYCSERCRAPARRAQRSAARLRHQRSPEGRADHRDHQRALRRRRRVMDQPSAEPSSMEILVVAAATETNAAAEEDRRDEVLYSWRPAEPRCRFCGRASVYLDCG